jgi:hypothetical protein
VKDRFESYAVEIDVDDASTWRAVCPETGSVATGSDPVACERALRASDRLLEHAILSVRYTAPAGAAYFAWLDNRGVE